MKKILLLLIIILLANQNIYSEEISKKDYIRHLDIKSTVLTTALIPGYGYFVTRRSTEGCFFLSLESFLLIWSLTSVSEEGGAEDFINPGKTGLVKAKNTGIGLCYSTLNYHVISIFDTYWTIRDAKDEYIGRSSSKDNLTGALYSFFMPGLGHYYNRDRFLGFIYYFTTTALLWYTIRINNLYEEWESDYPEIEGHPLVYSKTTRTLWTIGLVSFHLLDCIHAYLRGRNNNQKKEGIEYNIFFDRDDFRLCFNKKI